MEPKTKVPRRIAQAVLNSLKGGVVPRIGLPYVTVGRKNEISALLHDIDIIAEGGASFRFIMGKYGSGKSFLLQTIRNYAMDRGFVVADADLRHARAGPRDLPRADRQPFNQDPARGRRVDAAARPLDQLGAGEGCSRIGSCD